MTTLSESEFEERFSPSQQEDGNYFEFEDVKDLDHHLVWTVVETGDPDNESWYALPGFHRVNRLGYLVSTVPWDDEADGDAEAVWFEVDMEQKYADADFDHTPDPEDDGDGWRCAECGYLVRKDGTTHGVDEEVSETT